MSILLDQKCFPSKINETKSMKISLIIVFIHMIKTAVEFYAALNGNYMQMLSKGTLHSFCHDPTSPGGAKPT